MHKVIIERPRGGPRMKEAKGYRRAQQRTDIDEAPKREGMVRKWQSGWPRKHQTDLLGPLRRFLTSRLGRRWDEVYSELCEHIDKRNVIQNHLIDHVLWEVETHVIMCGAQMLDSSGRRLYRPFYVCPHSGRLKRTARNWFKKKKKQHKRHPRYPIDANRQYHVINGIWYEVTLRRFCGVTATDRDVVLKKKADQLTQLEVIETYGHWVFACGKRQLGKREIKRVKKTLGIR